LAWCRKSEPFVYGKGHQGLRQWRSNAGRKPIDVIVMFRMLAEGIAKAKAAGVYKGRPPSIDAMKVRDLKKKGLGASEIAKALKIGRASVYRALDAR
jgi:hypothetical protein